MPQDMQECEAHGTPTLLRCAEPDCGKPICPKCLVKTPVGLKCEEHAQAILPRFDRRVAPFALTALLLVAAAVVILALAVFRQDSGPAPTEDDTPAPAASGDNPRIVPASVYVVDVNGSSPRTLTNRPLAFDARPAWSPDGTRIAFESTIDGKRSIWIMAADGQNLRRLTEAASTASDSSPAWSPTGDRIAFTSDRDGNAEVYVTNADGSGTRRLTDNPAADGFPAWAPDGSRLAFVTDRDGQAAIWTMAADGTGPSRLIPGPVAPDARPAWSPTGDRIAFASDRDGGNLDIFVAPATSGQPITKVIAGPSLDGEPAWSPDGSKLAFASDRDGAPQVYVADRDGSNVRKLTTTPRSFTPAWAPDGTKLLYVNDPLPGG